MNSSHEINERVQELREQIDAYMANQRSSRESSVYDLEAEKRQSPVRAHALRLLSHRNRSRYELRERLLAAEYDSEVVDKVLEDLQSCGVVDDTRFAEEWVQQRLHCRGKSKWILDQELRSKGIARSVREHVLAAISHQEESEAIRALVDKKARTIQTLPHDWREKQKMLRKLAGYSARRGFSAESAAYIAREVLDKRLNEIRNECDGDDD